MFISEQFSNCPKCKKRNNFGVCGIFTDRYIKKCKSCSYSKSFKLPNLNKKIIYLDQFVISDMMKAINRKAGKIENVNKEFLHIFAELDSLVKAQLILCPDSKFHRDESMSYNYSALKRMYEQLSNATTFSDPQTIKRFQISDGFKKWLGLKSANSVITVDSLLHKKRNQWQDRFIVSVDFEITNDDIEQYQKSRLNVHEKIKQLFELWKNEKKSFQEYLEVERSEYGHILINNYLLGLQKLINNKSENMLQEDDYSFILGENNILFSSLMRYLPNTLNEIDKIQIIINYINSEDFKNLPFNIISSALWAAIEYQVSSGGRLNPPNIGMVTDIELVSTQLPYCDAIFLDRDMYSILQFGGIKKIIESYEVRIFSLTNVKQFYEYLNSIKQNATKEHYKLIEKVYGKSWLKPYYEMYEDNSKIN